MSPAKRRAPVKLDPIQAMTDVDAAHLQDKEARVTAKAARAELRRCVLAALAAGNSEAEVSRQAGINRMTVRNWAGKFEWQTRT